MLPRIEKASDLERLRLELEPWEAGLLEICQRHGFRGTPLPQRAGSLPVFALDEVIIKLYAPAASWAQSTSGAFLPDGGMIDYEAERSMLLRLSGQLPIPTPEVLADGELDGWRYLAMRKLRGRPLGRVLEEVSVEARAAALRELGVAVAALHAIDSSGLTSWVEDFEALIGHQTEHIVSVEQQRGAPARWLEPLAQFVRDTPRGAASRSLLHTELGPGHTLAERVDGRIVLTGLIDFVDAMVGDAEYDFAAVAFFLAEGDGALLGAFLDGYGWAGPRGMPLSRRLLRYLLLHRFAPLHWLLERRPPGTATDFEGLIDSWIGVA